MSTLAAEPTLSPEECRYAFGHTWVAVWGSLAERNAGEPPAAITCDGCTQTRAVPRR